MPDGPAPAGPILEKQGKEIDMTRHRKDRETFAEIIWTREDIRQLLEDNDLESSEEAVDRFLEKFNVRRFEEACIEDGWERLSRAL